MLANCSLSCGVDFPRIGLGTYKMNETDLNIAIPSALDAGYRMFDTAAGYKNETALSRILNRELEKREMKRSSIFITSKLKPADHGYDKTIACLTTSANIFGGYIDLFLIHWPGASKLAPTSEKNMLLRAESWNALQDAYEKTDMVRAIGVSNYTIRHLEVMKDDPNYRLAPMINQYELHLLHHPLDLEDYCREHSIHLQSYSTFGCGALLNPSHQSIQGILPQLYEIYRNLQLSSFSSSRYSSLSDSIIPLKYDRSETLEPCVPCLSSPTSPSLPSASQIISQISLLWALSKGFSVIPKSCNPEHILDNYMPLRILIEGDGGGDGYALTRSDMDFLDAIAGERGAGEKLCWDPSIVL